MKINQYLLIVAAFFLLNQIVVGEETEGQELSEEKKKEMQQFMEFQKLMEMQKQAESPVSSELQEFEESGLNKKHYQKAKRLNLDLENYTNYCSNRSTKIKSAVFMGVGGAFILEGLICFLCGSLFEATEDDYYSYYDDDFNEDMKSVYMITGGISCAAGAGLLIGGAIKRTRINEVLRKDGTKLSLMPVFDILDNSYGAELSFSF